MRREKHVKSFLKRLAAGAAATLMAVTTIIVNVEPMKARANDGYYTVIDQYNEFYGSVFGDLDPDMPGWWSTHFTVEDSDGETYSAMCAQPHVKTAENGQVVIDGDTYSSDEADDDRATYARILYWSIGHGGETGGPLYGYSYELRWIIAHHTFALAKGDENWNTSQSGNTFLRSDSIGYDLVMELLNYAANITTGDWHCSVKYLVNGEGYQDLLLYSEKYLEPPYDGSIKIKKSSDNETITNGNSCYSLAGAEFSVYNDEDCTDYLTTLVTDENGDTDTYTVHDIPKDETKTLYYKETKAPKGFLLNDEVKSITIKGEGTWGGGMYDVPETDPVTILLRKVNKETGGVSNGDGTLAGAKYVVKYYDTDMTTDPAKDGLEPKYTWKVQTDENGRINLMKKDCYIDGDELFTVDGMITFPLGTLTIQEYEAPTGYLVDETLFVNNNIKDKIYVNGVEQNNANSYQEASDTIIHLEQGVKGKISIKKTKQVIKDANAKAVLSSGKDTLTEAVPESGAVFQLYLKSAGSYDDAADDARDILYTDRNGLATSKDLVYGNYVLHQISGEDGFMMLDDMEVSITENGKTYQLNGNDAQKYSKLRLYKTGEVLTGYDSTNGFTYASKYVGGCTYGVYTDADCKNLIEKITTVDDTYAESKYEYLPGTYYAVIVDTVTYHGLIVGNTYTVSGYLMVKSTGKPLLDKKGNKITAKTTFDAEQADGTVDMVFEFDSSLLAGETIVCFEKVYHNGIEVACHEDLSDEDQSTFYPEIKTTANDGISGTKYNNGAEDIVIVDTVSYKNLIVGKEYVIKGVLKDKATGKSVINKATGKEITGEVKFTAEQKDGSIDVTFNFTRADLAGRTVVVFEKLYQNEIEVTAHEDLSDEGQTIVEPTKIGIIKIDDTSKTKKPLSGATLQILDKDGNVVEIEILTETKDENGNTVAAVKKVTSFVSGLEETVIVGLEPGTYKIHEVAAPWGYELTEDVVFVLGDKVELQHFVMADEAKVGLMNFSYNEKKDFEVAADSALVTPQTGDSSNMLKYMVIMLVSGIALLGCLFGKNKKAFIKVFGAVFVFLAVAFAGNNKTYAATTFTEEEKFESENKEAEYDFKKNKSKDGVDYTLTDVKYDVKAKQIANITKTNTVLVTDAAPVFEESIVENGITYRLKSVTTAEGDMGSRSVTYTKVYTYNGLTKTDDIPAVVAGSVRDEATNEVSTINMTQTGLVKKNEQKSDDFVFSINVVSGAYFMYKDNLVEYNAENPNLMQYKDSILEDLGLSKDIYTVESIEWTSEPEADADGMIHREATVKGYKEIADYEATYVATVDYPTANVVYTADYEADTTKNTTFYEIKGTATYQLTSEIVDTNASGTKKTDFKSVFKNPVVVGSFSAVVIVIIAVIAIVLWKKKSEKEVVE